MLRTGVIVCGAMGQNHARVHSEIARLVGVCDINKEAASTVGKRLGVPFSTDHRELLRQELDVKTIATPTFTHHRLVLDVLSAGKHLLIEILGHSTAFPDLPIRTNRGTNALIAKSAEFKRWRPRM